VKPVFALHHDANADTYRLMVNGFPIGDLFRGGRGGGDAVFLAAWLRDNWKDLMFNAKQPRPSRDIEGQQRFDDVFPRRTD
jgi:hypothetical protein